MSGTRTASSIGRRSPPWVANWQVSCPSVPAPFATWSLWQYDDAGTVPGITTACDLNQFDGTLSDLKGLTIGGSSAAASSTATSATASSTDAAAASSTV